MRHELRPITKEIEDLQRDAARKNRHVEKVFLDAVEMDQFAMEVKELGCTDDPRSVPAGDDFRWKGTIVLKDRNERS